MNYFHFVKLGRFSEIIVPDHTGGGGGEGNDLLISLPVKSTSTLMLDMLLFE